MSVSGVSGSLTGGYAGGRATLRGSNGAAQTAIAEAAQRLARATAEVSSGKRIQRPSDDVVGTDKALELRRALAAEERFAAASNDAKSWLGTTDTALQRSVALLHTARGLAVQAGADSQSPEGRAAIATQIRGIREDMLATANTTYLGRPVFGGTTAASVAFAEDAGGVVTPSAGMGNVVERTLAPGVDVRVDTAGTAAFGAGDDSVFAVLSRLETAVLAGAAESSAQLGDMTAALGRMTTTLADVGTRYARTESLQSIGTQRTLSLTSSQREVEDVDLAEALMNLATHEKAYQAALGAAAKVVTPTIMDFLR
ncbi:flagellin N-terminal helical domain-containing protein [Pseudokineococcus sp. 1T1Z-3]|uniref:flagellin N-terminal helical domain-containing protein n=1 Tax=Pseudokineococcus sp. 1T1Z-3 TaxID=3132745 RepID=UPI00309E54F5